MDDASRTRDRVRGRGRVGLGGGGARRRASVGVEEEGREDADERSRVGGDVRARFGEGGEEGGEEGWLSLELKGDAFRAESYAEIDAMAGEAARRFGKRPRVFVFSDNDYRGERWEIVRRSVRGLRNIKLAWAARDVEESARDARNVDARALRARGIGEVVFPSVKMSEEWYAKASRERLSLVPWIVDTREDVVRAVRLGVMGVITNTPLKTQKMLNEICGGGGW